METQTPPVNTARGTNAYRLAILLAGPICYLTFKTFDALRAPPDYPALSGTVELEILARCVAVGSCLVGIVFLLRQKLVAIPLLIAFCLSLLSGLFAVSDTIRHPNPSAAKRLQMSAYWVGASALSSARTLNGHFPPSLAWLVLDSSVVEHEAIRFDGNDRMRFSDPRPAVDEWPRYNVEVEQKSLFTYTAADLVLPAPPAALDPRIVLLYSRPDPGVQTYRAVVFADGVSRLVPLNEVPAVIAASNAARAAVGFPPFALDGPPPAPPDPAPASAATTQPNSRFP